MYLIIIYYLISFGASAIQTTDGIMQYPTSPDIDDPSFCECNIPDNFCYLQAIHSQQPREEIGHTIFFQQSPLAKPSSPSLSALESTLPSSSAASIVAFMGGSNNRVGSGGGSRHSGNNNAIFDEISSDNIASDIFKLGQIIAYAHGRDNSAHLDINVISPVNIFSALGMMSLGANGETFKQLSSIFSAFKKRQISFAHVQRELGWMLQDIVAPTPNAIRERTAEIWQKDPRSHNLINEAGERTCNAYIINIANAIFNQNTIALRSNYKKALNAVYQAQTTPLDFLHQPSRSTFVINNWVHTQTNGRIPYILQDNLPRNTQTILASTIYMKAYWEQPFTYTFTSHFYSNGLDKPVTPANMMYTSGEFPYYGAVGAHEELIALPYKQQRATMYIILPRASTRENILKYSLSLSFEKLRFLIDSATLHTADVFMPKINSSQTLTLSKIFKQIRLDSILYPNANYNIMTAGPNDPPNVADAAAASSSTTTPDDDGVEYDGDDVDAAAAATKGFHDDGLASLNSLDQLRKLYTNDAQSSSSSSPPSPYSANAMFDEIIHNVSLDINEQGTEAAAAVAAISTKMGPSITVNINRPFIFLIQDNYTKVTLFYGIVRDV